MAHASQSVDVYLEVGKKRTFASAVAWPGWCRSGRDEVAALEALVAHGPRYAAVAHRAGLTFEPPSAPSALVVVERLSGTSATEFGAPTSVPTCDRAPVEQGELERLRGLLEGCWHAFDGAVERASGRELSRGPRGGGRDLAGVAQHVAEAERGYLARLAWKLKKREGETPAAAQAHTRQAVLEALAAAVRGEVPAHGPRGGVIWPPRFFVRYVAWHVLDHAWDLENRLG